MLIGQTQHINTQELHYRRLKAPSASVELIRHHCSLCGDDNTLSLDYRSLITHLNLALTPFYILYISLTVLLLGT